MGGDGKFGYSQKQQIEDDHNANQHKKQHLSHTALAQLEKLGTD